MEPGLYDKDNNLIKSWAGLTFMGFDIEKNYGPDNVYSEESSGYRILEKRCSGTKLVISDKVVKIGSFALAACSQLTDIVIPDSVLYIGESAFYKCSNLKEITIPETVKRVGGGSLNTCKNLKKAIIKANIKEIEPFLFMGDKNLTSAGPIGSGCDIEYPDTIKIFNTGCFKDTRLEKIVFPSKIEEIYDSAFVNTNFSKIKFPDSLKRIGPNIIDGKDSKVSEITIPDIEKISPEAFKWANVEKIYIPKNPEHIPLIFFDIYKNKLDYIRTLDDLLDEGKSFKEINKMCKKGLER